MSNPRPRPLVVLSGDDPLDAALRDARMLRELLDLEAQALTAARPEQLMENSRRKRELAQRLESQSAALRDHLREVGSRGDPRARRLADLLRDCRRCNSENGVMISALGRHTRRALALLSGRTREATVYGPSGRELIVNANRHSARA